MSANDGEESRGPIDHCDDCGAALAYPGNRLGGSSYCDGCYTGLEAMLP